jgi:hypothetical protein
MAVVQISRIQHRRGLQQDLPNLSSAELGWSVSFPEWPDGIKDANEAAQQYGRVAVLQSVLSAIETSPLKIKLLARRWCV